MLASEKIISRSISRQILTLTSVKIVSGSLCYVGGKMLTLLLQATKASVLCSRLCLQFLLQNFVFPNMGPKHSEGKDSAGKKKKQIMCIELKKEI